MNACTKLSISIYTFMYNKFCHLLGVHDSKILELFIKAAEFIEIPVRRSDDEPLHKLFTTVRSELNLDIKNIKKEQVKFWKQHPALAKVQIKPIDGNSDQLFDWTSIWFYYLTSFLILLYSDRIVVSRPLDS